MQISSNTYLINSAYEQRYNQPDESTRVRAQQSYTRNAETAAVIEAEYVDSSTTHKVDYAQERNNIELSLISTPRAVSSSGSPARQNSAISAYSPTQDPGQTGQYLNTWA